MTGKKAAAAAARPATRAYVTFLAGDGDYWKDVVGLAKDLRKVGSAYPLVVAVLPDVPEALRRSLTSQGCIVREIEPVYPLENETQFAKAYYAINYSKLRIWEFVEYERMVYLDADVQVFANIDELFELDKGPFYAVMDCFCDKMWSHSPQYKIGYSQHYPDRQIGYFNTGVFVHEPGMATAKALLDILRDTPPTPSADQDFLNMFFRYRFKPIPNEYHYLVLAMLRRYPENVQLEDVKAVRYHCVAESKPWRYMSKEADMGREGMGIKMLVKKWWDIYNDQADKDKLPPFRDWLAQAKGVVFARKNLPAVATLAASSAAAGVVASAANPAICFGFYAVFVAAMAAVTISLRRI
ncbi:unnamed protein product [Urochloa decumbens]|uniref:Hexosyltransferase n=1 Tax=Urochloa decumbens TaxID=240449 RepID=A0ABC9C3Z6_9POAL